MTISKEHDMRAVRSLTRLPVSRLTTSISAAAVTSGAPASSSSVVYLTRRNIATLERFFRTEIAVSSLTVPADSFAFCRKGDGSVVSAGPRETLKLPRPNLIARVFKRAVDPYPVHLLYMYPMRFMLPDTTVTALDGRPLSLVATVQVRVITPSLAFEMASNIQSTFPALAARAIRAALAPLTTEETLALAAAAAASTSPVAVPAIGAAANATEAEAATLGAPALARAQEALTAMLSPMGFACESVSVLAAAPVASARVTAHAALIAARASLRAQSLAQLELVRARAAGIAPLLAEVADPSLRAALAASPALSEFVLLGPRDTLPPAAVAAVVPSVADSAYSPAAHGHSATSSMADAAAGAAALAAAVKATGGVGVSTPLERMESELDRVGGSVRAAYLEKNGGGETWTGSAFGNSETNTEESKK